MKKLLIVATLLCLGACYTPLNNSGVATTKSWLDIPAKRTDFEGKQYDFCYQFNLKFRPASAAKTLDLQADCISACCWQSDKEEVVLDFNRNYEADLKRYGRARRYTPGQITLKPGYSSLVNTSSVKISPRASISQSGLVKLTFKETEDLARLEEVKQEARRDHTLQNALRAEQQALREEDDLRQQQEYRQNLAKSLVQRQKAAAIDSYFFPMEKEYKQKDQLFLLGRRIFTVSPSEDAALYKVSCEADVQTGYTAATLKTKTMDCGLWAANLETLTVEPVNRHARKIDTAHQRS